MTERPARIVLVGMMGAGKSTVAVELARRLGWECIDMDHELERQAGLSVPELFARFGEEGFRARELALARVLARRERVVVAAGGGAFAVAETRAALRQGALTVWLRCRLDTVLARVDRGGVRPLATSRERIERLLAEREPSYRLADRTFDADAASPADIARHIEEALLSGAPPAAERTS